MICKAKGCNRDTEFDVDEWCNYHWKTRISYASGVSPTKRLEESK